MYSKLLQPSPFNSILLLSLNPSRIHQASRDCFEKKLSKIQKKRKRQRKLLTDAIEQEQQRQVSIRRQKRNRTPIVIITEAGPWRARSGSEKRGSGFASEKRARVYRELDERCGPSFRHLSTWTNDGGAQKSYTRGATSDNGVEPVKRKLGWRGHRTKIGPRDRTTDNLVSLRGRGGVMGHPGCRFIPMANPRFSSTVIHLELDEEIPVCRRPCEITRRFKLGYGFLFEKYCG